jgi:hypothetical protein
MTMIMTMTMTMSVGSFITYSTFSGPPRSISTRTHDTTHLYDPHYKAACFQRPTLSSMIHAAGCSSLGHRNLSSNFQP